MRTEQRKNHDDAKQNQQKKPEKRVREFSDRHQQANKQIERGRKTKKDKLKRKKK
jgi:hypothetical protein